MDTIVHTNSHQSPQKLGVHQFPPLPGFTRTTLWVTCQRRRYITCFSNRNWSRTNFAWTVFILIILKTILSSSPRFSTSESNTTSDWLNRTDNQSEVVLLSNATKYRKIWRTRRRTFLRVRRLVTNPTV